MGQPLSATGTVEAGRTGLLAAGRRLAAVAADLLFPLRCAWCAVDLPAAESVVVPRLCAPCAAEFAHAATECPFAAPDRGAGTAGPGPTAGATDPRCLVLGPYAGPLREAVLRCKRPAGALVAQALGGLVAERHAERLRAWCPDVVVPVPMHWLRRLGRGTSATGDIARGLARAAGLPVVAALRRTRATVMQNRIPVADRQGNLADAIAVRRAVAGRRVLLVDDVMTTGATLRACHRALAAGGAAAVAGVVVARARASDA
ncbi:MAG: ComF family protein [Planctomycetes bacterium]|nr:ComF family protein [Planctomycetota bacterium]MBM4056638.1 ComF family protein [Planctomycetota bacterium]